VIWAFAPIMHVIRNRVVVSMLVFIFLFWLLIKSKLDV